MKQLSAHTPRHPYDRYRAQIHEWLLAEGNTSIHTSASLRVACLPTFEAYELQPVENELGVT